MKNPMHSISFKIWKTMVFTIGLFMIAIFLVNITVISHYKEALTYQQLEEAFNAKFTRGEHTKKLTETEGILLISHFGVVFNTYDKDLIIDKFTKDAYSDKKGVQVLGTLADRITSETPSDTYGKIKIDSTTYLYYVQWDDENKIAMVFFAPKSVDNGGLFVILGLFIGLMIISFFTSRVVAGKLCKPIQELEVFAEEIAHRNWNAMVPKTDNDEIGLLAKSLENMRDSLKIADERDRKFLQSTSHDLKTPVMIIKGYAQALIDGISIESEQSAANVIMVESDRLERRITQLLRLNTLGHSLEHMENRELVSIDRMIKSLVSHCKVVAPNLKWELELTSCEVMGDKEALRIAIENILDNQLRYAKHWIKISMKCSDIAHITIENDGAPFLVEDPMILFDPYKKEEEGKFGLGLAIAHQVIKAHNGVIRANNTTNGVEFNIDLNCI